MFYDDSDYPDSTLAVKSANPRNKTISTCKENVTYFVEERTLCQAHITV